MRHRIRWGVALLLLALGVAAWLGVEAPRKPASSTAARVSSAPASASADTHESQRGEGSRAARSTAPSAPLPPPDAPLATVYPELKRRADAGDVHAACRVAFELIRCRTLGSERDTIDTWLRREEASLDDQPDFRWAANVVARRQIRVAERATDCTAVPAADLDAGGDYLYRAARAGVLDAQVHYIEGHMFGLVADRFTRAPGHGYLHHPEFERWRREALPMARSLLDARRAIGLTLMAEAYLHDERPFTALVADDRALAFAYIETSRASNNLTPRPETQFSAAERARIAALRRELPADQFHSDDGTLEAGIAPALQLDEVGTRCL